MKHIDITRASNLATRLGTSRKLGLSVLMAFVVVAQFFFLAAPASAQTSTVLAQECVGEECLPAWRWDDAELWTPQNLFDAEGAGVTQWIGNLFLGGANFIWRAIRGLLDLALDDRWLEVALQYVNDAFISIWRLITVNSPIMGFGLVAGLFGVFLAAFRFGVASGGFLSQFIRFALPLALLLSLTTAALRSQNPGDFPKGSPAWVAAKASDLVNSSLAIPEWAQFNNRDSANTGGCVDYIAHLHARADGNLSGSDNEKAYKRLISRFWEGSYLTNFYEAQFGSVHIGEAVGCRLLESQAGIPPSVQAAIDGGRAAQSHYVSEGDNDAAKAGKLLEWAVCDGGEEWKLFTRDEFGCNLGADYAGAGTGLGGRIIDWLKGAGFLGNLIADSAEASTADGIYSAAQEQYNRKVACLKDGSAMEGCSPLTGQAAAQAASELEFVGHMTGDKGTRMMASSIVAFLNALVVAVVLGGLLIGAALGSIYMAAMMMILPITLLSLAIERTRDFGRKALNYTFAALFVKVILSLILVVVITATSIVQEIIAMIF